MTKQQRADRFEAAKLGPDHARAMARRRPDIQETPVTRVLLGHLLFGLCLLGIIRYGYFITGDHTPVMAVLGAAFWVAILIVALRARIGPVTRRLALVDDNWTDHRPVGSLAMARVTGVTLWYEDDTRASHPATDLATRQADPGSIGVAFFRRRALIAFERLDA